MEKHRLDIPAELLIPGEKVELTEKLGQGHFGEVYSGSWEHTSVHSTSVAVKQLKNVDADSMKELAAEIKIQVALKSPYVVKLFGVTLKQCYGLVMEYMPNKSMRSYLKERQPSEVTWVIRIGMARDVATGMNYLHTLKPTLIHGDLKAENVMLDKDYCAKIADFGLAKFRKKFDAESYYYVNAHGEKPSQGEGCIPWMAPELFYKNGKNTRASDVYAFGMLMWEICSHQTPFQDVNPFLLAGEIIKGNLDPWPANTQGNFKELGDQCRSMQSKNRPSMAKALSVLGALGHNHASSREERKDAIEEAGVYIYENQGDAYGYNNNNQPGINPVASVDEQAQKIKVKSTEVTELLEHTMRGDLCAVQIMLNINKALVDAQGDITDLSNSTFPKITAFQYALWALDQPMWELILKYLPEDQAALQLKALEEDREDITSAHGAHFSIDLIIDRLKYSIDNLASSKNPDAQKRDWSKVGLAQSKFPAWLIMTICEEGGEVAWVKGMATHMVKRNTKHLKWWKNSIDFGNFGILRLKGEGMIRVSRLAYRMMWTKKGSGSIGGRYCSSGMLENTIARLKIFHQHNLGELAKLKVQLHPNDPLLISSKKDPGY